MSIIRVGLAQTQKYSEGYEAIFGGGKKAEPAKKAKASAKSSAAKKPAKSKKAKKK
ncbi:MAG: hypothetical protein K2R98_33360 [Gemmataceae bacterium]|nr:hypothetical protein [Gemmataceae bacterium]